MDHQRLHLIRGWLSDQGLQGFVQPHEDEYLGEFVPAAAERLAWLTGFTGSAGTAVVLADQAALFVDGRYTIQARAQVDSAAFQVLNVSTVTPEGWLAKTIAGGARIGIDSRLMSVSRAERLDRIVRQAGGNCVPVSENPVDCYWADRPPPPAGDIRPHPAEAAGESSADKRSRLAEMLSHQEVHAVVLTAPESIAWLLNIRGTDLPYSPVVLASAVLHGDGCVRLFLRSGHVPDAVQAHLGPAVRVEDAHQLSTYLSELGANKRKVQIDPVTTPAWISAHLLEAGASVHRARDPVLLPKAIKNSIEVDGMRQVHELDGLALVKFLSWLDDNASGEAITELSASRKLEEFRRECPAFRSPSFPTISGTGAHGAIVHYRAEPDTDQPLRMGDLYLVDSGGQYPGGTTDVTRTVAIGQPQPEMCQRFTQVLKGHIAIATARFPRGTPGGQLDILARMPLWQAGVTYDHGTGHGVGSYLNVHEGPQSISFRVASNGRGGVSGGALEPLVPGMVISNEPGYYREGSYGIRIENLVLVEECPAPDGAEIELLSFETLTLAPIDRRLISTELLDSNEVRWIDVYHQRVLETLAPNLPQAASTWLQAACAPLTS